LIADFGQLLARLLQSVADFLRKNTANKRRSKSGQKGDKLADKLSVVSDKIGEKVRKK